MTIFEFLAARITEDEMVEVPIRHAAGAWAWSPERVMAECEAKRRTLELLDNAVIGWDELTVGYSPEDWLAKQIARAMALPYADHPDYDEAWRP